MAVLLAPVWTACDAPCTTEPADIQPQLITYGFIDENETHGNVGAFIVQVPSTGEIFRSVRGH